MGNLSRSNQAMVGVIRYYQAPTNKMICKPRGAALKPFTAGRFWVSYGLSSKTIVICAYRSS